jgi:hypothetical protein
MALSNETSKQIFVCTGGTVYTVPFYFLQDSDLTVYREDAAGDISYPLTLTTDYTLTGAGSESGGELTTVATYSDGKLIVVRNVDYTQRLDLIQGDGFRPDTLEQELDRIVMQVQQIKRRLDVAFQLPDYDTSGADTTIPVPEAGKVLSWNEDGSALINETPQHTILENGSVTAPKIADRAVTVEKLPVGQYWTTGDAKLTIKTTPDSGWIMADDGTIGDASSGASNRANADCELLYALLWNNLPDAVAPVAGGRGASASADWSAHKPIQVGTIVGRAIAIVGSGSGLTTRSLGDIVGEETHQLTIDEMPSHGHALKDQGGFDDNSGSFLDASLNNSQALNDDIIEATGGDQAHNNMQPTAFMNVMVKL